MIAPSAPPLEALRLPANPGAGYAALKEEIDAAVLRVLGSGLYLQGRETEAFEGELAAYHGVREAVTTGSGTEALELALRTLGIGRGDAVATVSHTAVATVAAIDVVGAEAVLVDVDPSSFTMDPQALAKTLQADRDRRIRAVLPVHLYGHPADMPAILEIAAEYDLPVIEDCAQSHGATLRGRKTGTFGTFGAFSFYPTKNLGALGDAGALITDDPELAERARRVKQYGWRERYVSEVPGINTRMDEIQAAILQVKLPHLDADNDRRRALAARYDTSLEVTTLARPRSAPGVEHVYHQYVIRSPRRDALRDSLRAQGIGCAVLYPVPVHLQPGYRRRVRLGAGGLPVTEALCAEILSLPLHPYLPDPAVRLVCEAVCSWSESEAS